MKHTILYISDVSANAPIFHSQVIPHINGLKKDNHVLLIGMKRRMEYEYDYDYSYPSILGDFYIPIALLNFVKHKESLKEFLFGKNFDLIFSRGLRGGLLGALIKHYIFKDNIKMINDVRADVIDEYKRKRKQAFGIRNTIGFIFKKSDVLFFVSSYLKDKYINKFNFKGQYAICPTFVPDGKFSFSEESRIKVRQNLGFSPNDIVLLYSGNYAKHQNVNIILDAFNMSTNRLLKLLILTKDERFFKDPCILKKLNNNNNIIIQSVQYSDIQAYYSAADFGLLIRDNIPTNICSAPTKFSEYLNSGLSIIGTRIESDYCKFLDANCLNDYLIEDKYDLTALFNRLENPGKRTFYSINTLSEIIAIQNRFFDLELRILNVGSQS